jgi:hypothetical protein
MGKQWVSNAIKEEVKNVKKYQGKRQKKDDFLLDIFPLCIII